MLFNLIRNAIRHTPRRRQRHRARRARRRLGRDRGRRHRRRDPAEERERVFEPFVRGEDGALDGGAGLGLAISRAIVEAHGGRIWLADSEVGTRVRFVIPT